MVIIQKPITSKLWLQALSVLHYPTECVVSTLWVIANPSEVGDLAELLGHILRAHFFWVKKASLQFINRIPLLSAIEAWTQIHLPLRRLIQFLCWTHGTDKQPVEQLTLPLRS